MNQYHHGNLREALLQEGLKHLTETGNRNISLREMAKRCGVSSAAPYAHFKTKDQFLLAIEYYMLEKLALELRAIRQNIWRVRIS